MKGNPKQSDRNRVQWQDELEWQTGNGFFAFEVRNLANQDIWAPSGNVLDSSPIRIQSFGVEDCEFWCRNWLLPSKCGVWGEVVVVELGLLRGVEGVVLREK